MNQELPRYIAIRALCKALNGDRKPEEWRPQRISRILKNMGILVKRGQYLYVRPEDLAAAWPDAYEEIVAKLAEIKPYVRPRYGKNRTNLREPGNSGSERKYDYDAHPCSYEVGAGWSCGPECADPRHK